jgi:hypothetical protein
MVTRRSPASLRLQLALDLRQIGEPADVPAGLLADAAARRRAMRCRFVSMPPAGFEEKSSAPPIGFGSFSLVIGEV